MYDVKGEDLLLVYEAKPGNCVTIVSFLENNKIAFIEEGQLYILDLSNKSKVLIDSSVNYFIPLIGEEQVLYISDYNFILKTDY